MSNLENLGTRRLYRHSGKVPPVGFLVGATAAVTTGVVLGSLYGALGLWAHLIPVGKLMFLGEVLLAVGFGFGLAALPVLALRKFKVRSTLAALASTFLAFLVGYYCAWVFWIYVLAIYWGDALPLAQLFRPDLLLLIIQDLNEKGVWGLGKNDTPSGTFLWVIWACEAACILVGALFFSRTAMNAKMFCEHCLTWGTQRPLMNVRGDAWPAIQNGLATGNIDAFESAGAPAPGDASWLAVSLEGCATCDNLQALNIERTTVTTDKKGNVTTQKKRVVTRQLITPEQTAQLALIAASLAAPAPAPEPPAAAPPAPSAL